MTDPISGDTLSTPDPTIQTLVLTLLRTVLQIASTVGLTLPAWANVSNLVPLSSGIVLLGTIIWSFWQKFSAARAAHATAVASANTGVAVKGTPA